MSVLDAIQHELERAQSRFPKFASAHEAIAVIREEYLELEHEIFHGDGEAALTEAIQLAAMAARYAVEIGVNGRNEEAPA
jgi:hypothetical protein